MSCQEKKFEMRGGIAVAMATSISTYELGKTWLAVKNEGF
jgi:hypothetical protein